MDKIIIKTIEEFSYMLSDIQKEDWWIFLGCSGSQGSGKSCFTSQTSRLTAQKNKIPFSYKNNMTYLREEVKTWIDGKGEQRKGQKPEYSSILADELISMFFKRNWHNSDQSDSIELLNKCRDRHLMVAGNIPTIWDLDKPILGLLTHWIHIPRRGVAWVFVPDKNPFVADKWNVTYNKKVFDKYNHPYFCRGFLCEIHFDDWSPEEKIEYYEQRNKKRVNTEGQGKQKDKYAKIKAQRDEAIAVLSKFANTNDRDLHAMLPECSYDIVRRAREAYFANSV